MNMNMSNMNSHGPFPQGSPRMMGWSPHGPNPMGPNMQMMPEFDDFGPGGPINVNLLRSKVPNENLTPIQVQRREEQLAKIRKISQMLLPEEHRGGVMGPQHMGPQQCGPGRGPGPGGPMMPDGMHPMFQQGMMSPPGMMEQSMGQSQSMITSPHGMMSSQQQFMMSQQGMPQFGPQPQNVNPAQREWMRLQEEFYNEQRQRQMQMNPNVDPNSAQGPPPSYLTSIAQKRQGVMRMGRSTSPNLNGPHMHGSSPEHDPLMFPGPAMGPRHPLSPMDPTAMVPGFSSPMHSHGGGMDPNMIPNMPGKNGPPDMIPPSSMTNMKAPPHVSLHRVGNPEQFQPDIPGVNSGPVGSSNNALNSKPPPSYAQAQKRKRDDLDEIYKNLQPTPSPQQINYLNQFEGQELTITKQLNTAYRETNSAGDPQLNHFQHNQVNSPMHGPNSNKQPMSNSSQTSSVGPLSSPGPLPGPSPLSHMSGANMRLSHYDPPSSSVISSAPTTPTVKASMSNITSASLANLAKGVEHLSNQMQQNMMQGGPFHSIQIQNQMGNNSSQNGSQQSQQQQQQQQPQQHPNPQHSQQQQQQQTQQQQQQQSQPHIPQQQHPPTSLSQQIPGSSIGHSQSTPSINNTYVNATMSIQQLNIQTNNPGSQGYNPSMQVQQMNSDTHMTSSGPGPGPVPGQAQPVGPGGMPQGPGMPSGPGGMQQASVAMSHSQMLGGPSPVGPGPGAMNHGGPVMGPNGPPTMGPAPMVPGGPSGMVPGGSAPMTSQGMGPGPGGIPMGPGKSPQFPSPNHSGITSQPSPMMPQGGAPGGRMASPGFSPNSVGNASVQIQPKAPNTIQYLPANPPASQANMPGPKRSVEMEYMQRFASPLTNLEGKNPTSTLQYFPTNSGPNMKLSGMAEPPFLNQQMTMQQQQSMMMHGGNVADFPPGMGPPDGMPPQMANMFQQMEGAGASMGQMNKMANMGMMDGPNHMSPMNNNIPPEAMLAMQGGMGPSGPGMGAMNFGPGGSMGSMSPLEMRGGMGNGHAGGPGFMPNGQSVGGSGASMLQSHHMQMQGPGGMPGMPMQGPGMPRQHNPNSVRMPGNPNMMAGGPQNYNVQYQQFQQQLYSQTRPRQMSPMSGMMGSPGQPYMGMMPNMP